MYEQFYGLEKPAFNITPDPDFLYQSPSHREALAAITYGVERRKGFIAILGEVGLGKTTVLRAYIATIDPTKLAISYVFNANVSFKELVHNICRDLDIPHPPQEELYWLLSRLHHFLLGEHQHGRNVLVVVDEAQNMPVDTLENLRVLSNLESGQEKLLQMVLVGQTEFGTTLESQQLRQLRQRIAVRCTLDPLTPKESREYIEFRLSRVGGSTAEVFTKGALNRIVAHAEGIPRVLNIVCDNALITGLGYQKKPVTRAIVDEVIADLTGRRAKRLAAIAWEWVALQRRWLWGIGAAALVAAAGIAVVPYAWSHLDVSSIFSGNRPAAEAAAQGPASTRTAAPKTGVRTADGRGAAPPAARPAPARTAQAAGAPAAGPAGLGQAAERPAPQPDAKGAAGFVVRGPEVARVVNAGDTLHSMALDIYGFVDEEVLRRVLQNNPDITNRDKILVGSVIRFPDVSDIRAMDVPGRRYR
jgi:general secretion pathway protein A